MSAASSRSPFISHRMVLQYHPIFGQWYVPNLRAYVPHERGYYSVRTNQDGMRASRTYDRQQPSGTVRLLLFGDSYTAGFGVHNEERFSDLMVQRSEDIEVLNFGVDGSGIDQQVLVFEHLGHEFGGDVVLWCPSVGDIRHLGYKYWPEVDRTTGETLLMPKPYFLLQDGQLHLAHQPVPRERVPLLASPRTLQRQFRFALEGAAMPFRKRMRRFLARAAGPWKNGVLRLCRYQPFPEYDSPLSPNWRLASALCARLMEQAGHRTVVVAPLPRYEYIEAFSAPTYRERYRQLAHDYAPRLRFVDLLPYFHALSKRQRRQCRFRQDSHYTPLGHRVVAEALITELRRLGLLQRSIEPATAIA